MENLRQVELRIYGSIMGGIYNNLFYLGRLMTTMGPESPPMFNVPRMAVGSEAMDASRNAIDLHHDTR